MDWLFDHLGKFLPVLIILLLALSKTLKKGGQNQRQNRPQIDPDEAERTRRIQEEIKRRIIERQRGGTSTPPAAPARRAESMRQPRQVEVVVAEETRAPAASFAEYEAKIESVRRQAETIRRSSNPGAMAAGAPSLSMTSAFAGGDASWEQTVAARPLRRDLLADLKRPGGLKRAVLLREILGPPPGLSLGSLPRR